ncbi:MFS transporter [Nocardia sp. NPDC052112]|uniref:MFS transporter n=1 Tax=Nocardia sp. NPDC052112 TaxID=3155646 RepID=UPI0034136E8D
MVVIKSAASLSDTRPATISPAEKRARAVGIWSGVTVGGALIGLLTAGGLVEMFSWRSVFVFNVALTAITLAATVLIPRQIRSGGAHVDVGVGLLVLTGATADSSYLSIGVGVFLLGSGIAFAATPATEAIMAALPPEQHGVASALNDVTRELGGVLGIALLGSVFGGAYRDRVAAAVAQLPPDLARSAQDSAAAGVAIGSAPGAPPQLLSGVLVGFHHGMSTAFGVGIGVVLAGAVLAVVTGRRMTITPPMTAVDA